MIVFREYSNKRIIERPERQPFERYEIQRYGRHKVDGGYKTVWYTVECGTLLQCVTLIECGRRIW